jgi:dihydroorotase
MLTLRNVRIWDTGERIDLRVPSAGSTVGTGVTSGDIDATGLTLAPGFADPHVHFRDPGQLEKETMVSGCRAAAAGGYTHVLVMPNTIPAMDGRPLDGSEPGASAVLESGSTNVIEYLRDYERLHSLTLPVHYDLSVCASSGREGLVASDPHDWARYVVNVSDWERSATASSAGFSTGSVVAAPTADNAASSSASNEGIAGSNSNTREKSGRSILNTPISYTVTCNDTNSYGAARSGNTDDSHPIVAITDDGSAVSGAILDAVLANAKATGLPLIEHCEHHDSGIVNDGAISRKLGVPGIPAETELVIVERDIEAARRTGVHIHFQHVSTAAAFDAIREAKAERLPITCETAPHYLALCDEDILRFGTLAKMNPPLRSSADRAATIAAIADGTVDMLATDHAPHTVEEKNTGLESAPNGITGLETAYGVCHTVLVDGGHISEQRLITLMSVNPMRLLNGTATDITTLLDKCVDERDSAGTRRTLDLTTLHNANEANLVVLDTSTPWTVDPERLASKARNTPFGGWKVTGHALATILDGRLVFSALEEQQ